MYCGICVLLLGCLGYNCNQFVDLDCIVVFVLYCYLDVWVIIVIKLLTLIVLWYLCCIVTCMLGYNCDQVVDLVCIVVFPAELHTSASCDLVINWNQS